MDGAKERRWWPAKGGGGGLEVVAEKFSQGEKEMREWRLEARFSYFLSHPNGAPYIDNSLGQL